LVVGEDVRFVPNRAGNVEPLSEDFEAHRWTDLVPQPHVVMLLEEALVIGDAVLSVNKARKTGTSAH